MLANVPYIARSQLISRAFSGTLISHDVFVVLDVMWLAGVLKPILDHRGVTKNEMGETVRSSPTGVIAEDERERHNSRTDPVCWDHCDTLYCG